MDDDIAIYYLDTVDDNYGEGADGAATAEAIAAAIRHKFPDIAIQIRRDNISCTWRACQNADVLNGDVDQWLQDNLVEYVVYRDTGEE